MDVLCPQILVIDGRQYRLNIADCCPNIYSETENLPSYVERDGETQNTDSICDEIMSFIHIV